MATISMQMPVRPVVPFGALLRAWRQRRRRSQLDLALDAEVSQRHLSFVESGRAAPSREMILRLAEQLDVPLRERNTLLLAAGYAPLYAERPLDDPSMQAARGMVDQILRAHMPHPALAIDRHWHMVAANAGIAPLLLGVEDAARRQRPSPARSPSPYAGHRLLWSSAARSRCSASSRPRRRIQSSRP